MQPCITKNTDAPSNDVYQMFSQLTPENKQAAIRFIADLKEKQ